MKIKSLFSDELKFEEYFKMRSKMSDYDLSTTTRGKKMSDEELEIYKQKYEEFSKKYILMDSKGGAGMIIKSNNQVSTPYKLYMDPGLNTLDFAESIMNKCKDKGLDYAIKLMTPEELNERCEKLILYGSSAKNISELYDILNELIQENDSIEFGKPPIFSDNINGKIGFGYDNLEANMSYNTWMSKTIQKAGAMFADAIKSEVPKEYIDTIRKRVKLKDSLRDFPELREKFRLYLNDEYLNAIKDIPEIDEIITFDDNHHHRIDTIAINGEKTTEINSQDNSTEQLPEGAEWKLNSSGKYLLQIKGKDGSKMNYSAEVASKKFGVKIPGNQLLYGAEWKLNSRGEYNLIIKGEDGSKRSYAAEVASKKFGVKIPESQLQEGAQWKLNSSGKYMLIINEDGAKKSYSAEVASKKFGITPPIIKNPQSESKLPIARDTKKSVENIAREGLSRDVQKTSTEIKEIYKELENPTQTKDIKIQ